MNIKRRFLTVFDSGRIITMFERYSFLRKQTFSKTKLVDRLVLPHFERKKIILIIFTILNTIRLITETALIESIPHRGMSCVAFFFTGFLSVISMLLFGTFYKNIVGSNDGYMNQKVSLSKKILALLFGRKKIKKKAPEETKANAKKENTQAVTLKAEVDVWKRKNTDPFQKLTK
ncbi:hypothetical protein K501DRAFT_277008 [Backusella circina FSU 941]|nr:hypothetical protein K501DRAFT_277008 [Backusella circina FSU 941]